MDYYEKLAEEFGLKLEVSHLQELDEVSVEGPTEKVLAFRDKTSTYEIGWFDLGNGASIYCFVE